MCGMQGMEEERVRRGADRIYGARGLLTSEMRGARLATNFGARLSGFFGNAQSVLGFARVPQVPGFRI